MLLICDLDETLIHATISPIKNISYNCEIKDYYIYLRPGLYEFLDFVSKHFQLAIWSSGSDDYVEAIVSKLFYKYKFEFVYGRSKCTEKPMFNYYGYKILTLKKLSKIKKKFPLEQVLIIDDTESKCAKNYGNAIYIPPYEGVDDNILFRLSQYLMTLKDVENVRTIEKREWLDSYR